MPGESSLATFSESFIPSATRTITYKTSYGERGVTVKERQTVIIDDKDRFEMLCSYRHPMYRVPVEVTLRITREKVRYATSTMRSPPLTSFLAPSSSLALSSTLLPNRSTLVRSGWLSKCSWRFYSLQRQALPLCSSSTPSRTRPSPNGVRALPSRGNSAFYPSSTRCWQPRGESVRGGFNRTTTFNADTPRL